MSRSLKHLRQKIKEQKPATLSKRTLPSDPIQFCREWLYYEPYEYMYPFLRDKAHFVANLQARQTGKTFNGMAKVLYLAFRHPGSLTLITAPKFDQVKNIAFKALTEHLRRMEAHDPEFFRQAVGRKNLQKTVIRLRNGSQILAESPVPETIRGHTAKTVYLMECNFIRDSYDLYTAILFTINTTNGFIIAESTPWNSDSVFYSIYHDQAYSRFSTHTVPYTEAMPPNGPLNTGIVEMIQNQLKGDSARWRREMLCEWTEDTDTWLPTSLIALAQDSSIRYIDIHVPITGQFYAGADFGKKQDHSVVTLVEKKSDHKYLRHIYRFPLDTPYGAVIGYLKQLQDNCKTIYAVYADKTGVGDYIVEDMIRGGIRNVTGINFTDTSKEAMATCLKENMRTAECSTCGWRGFIDTNTDQWHTTCPNNCNEPRTSLRPLLHIPYDKNLYAELNVERYELGKTGKLHFNHPEGTHDDMFWATALAIYAADNTTKTGKPVAKII